MLGGVQNLEKIEKLADEDFTFEKQQERLLMSKLTANGKLPVKPQSAFLQKKLQQQRKFFDSGDYAMNKQKTNNPSANLLTSHPHNIAHRSASVSSAVQSEVDTPLKIDVSPTIRDESLLIPRPDTVPQRKSSIIYPSVHSKLSPQPYIHHSTHDSDLLPGP
uniref:mRNA stability protein n=1 Tax=Elaeophora elaphi TaxID=1147741 RepID=A0A0R3S3Z5_9BILA